MPLIPFQHQSITIPVAAHGATGLPQSATFTGLRVSMDADGNYTLIADTRADLLRPDGSIIPTTGSNSPRPVPLTADNNWAVYFNDKDPADPRNGQPLYCKRAQILDEWGSLNEAGEFTPLPGGLLYTPEPLMLQGDWAEMVLMAMLGPMIQANMVAANQPPFNRYI